MCGLPIFLNGRNFMRVKSRISNLVYEDTDCVCIVNPKQVYAYLSHVPQPTLYDLFCGYNERLVFVFNRDETELLKKKWDNYELSSKNGTK